MNVPKKKPKVSIISSCYRGEPYLEAFLENLAQQTIFGQCEIVLDHNEPTAKEIEIVERFKKRYPTTLDQNFIDRVVPVTVSINNCIRAATGDYLCVACVDDRRPPDSIERMCKVLDDNQEVDFTYGDQILVDQIGKREGRIDEFPEFNKKDFLFDYYLGAAFFMFKKRLIDKVGYWDEQFLSGSDFDFQIRIALCSRGKKTQGIVGYFLNAGQGASQGAKHLPEGIQFIERAVIELRYSIYNKLRHPYVYKYLKQAKKYRIDQMLLNGKWVAIEEVVPNYQNILIERAPIRLQFERLYRYRHLYKIKHLFLLSLKKIGLHSYAKRLYHRIA